MDDLPGSTPPAIGGLPRAIDGAEVRFELLRRIAARPDLSQRDLARQIGISLGRVNYCLRALIEKGEVKVGNFRRSDAKLRYAYIITPKGIEAKVRLTRRFLQRKLAEYEQLQAEIEALRAEGDLPPAPPAKNRP